MKKKKEFQIKIAFIVSLILLLTCNLGGKVFARDNLAFSVGTKAGGINTAQDMNDAANAYLAAGYHSYGIIDPEPLKLAENLRADVQFYSGHGAVNNVQFLETGIVVGNTGNYDCNGVTKPLIGTNAIPWNNYNTILVTYSSCESAGTNNNNDTNSITCKTAEKGALVAVGFREKINAGSATNWNKRYNQKLGEGYGVNDAVNYANSFTYLFPNVKKVQIWHHGDANIKIGKYRSSGTDLDDKRNILNQEVRQTVHNDIESISSIIKEVYPEFNINNYEISYIDGTKTSLVNSNYTISDTNYIDLQFKLGDFYTNAGYTVEIRNNIVTAIYDNNINVAKQENLINASNFNNIKLTHNEIDKLKQEAKQQMLEKYNNKINIVDNEINYKLYYDLNTDKQYVIFAIPNNIGTDKISGLAIDNIQIEI